MTIAGHRPSHSGPTSAGHPLTMQDDPVQAYLRRRHETNAGQASDGEPQRGRDPWLGLAL